MTRKSTSRSGELLMRVFVPFSSDAELAAIGKGLLAQTLPKSEWNHGAHFAAALWLLEINAADTMPELIRRYNKATGVANTDMSGYHQTITLASIHAARIFRKQRPQSPIFTVCNELMATQLGKSDWLLSYWSREKLFSVEARRSWVEPDLKPLQF
jgi:hypothetical protein